MSLRRGGAGLACAAALCGCGGGSHHAALDRALAALRSAARAPAAAPLCAHVLFFPAHRPRAELRAYLAALATPAGGANLAAVTAACTRAFAGRPDLLAAATEVAVHDEVASVHVRGQFAEARLHVRGAVAAGAGGTGGSGGKGAHAQLMFVRIGGRWRLLLPAQR